MSQTDRILAADRDHVWHPWAVQGKASPLAIAHAEGALLWDTEGNRYLDWTSQLVFTNVGHQHPRVVSAIVNQAQTLATAAPNYAVDIRGQAAELVAQVAPEGFGEVFFTTGGTEAVENAVRAARAVTGRRKVLSTYRSYHGNTATSIAATGDPRRWSNEFATDHVHFFGPFLYRTAFWSQDEEEESVRALEHLRAVIEMEGPQSVAAVLLETVVGAAGVIPPPPGYLAGVRELCDEFEIMLILDEVMVGFGRTGRWFALEHYDVVPDLIVAAKGINSGYVPLGAVLMGPKVAEAFRVRPFPGGMTYSGHPLACAAAVGTIRAMADEGLVERADRLGREVLGPGLQRLAASHPVVGEVRGLGAFWALELVADPVTREPLAPMGGTSASMVAIAGAARSLGLLVLPVHNRLHLAPPLILTDEQADEGLAVLEEVLSHADLG